MSSGVKVKVLSYTYPNLSFYVQNMISAQLQKIDVLLNGQVIQSFDEDLEEEKSVDLSGFHFHTGGNQLEVSVESVAMIETYR